MSYGGGEKQKWLHWRKCEREKEENDGGGEGEGYEEDCGEGEIDGGGEVEGSRRGEREVWEMAVGRWKERSVHDVCVRR